MRNISVYTIAAVAFLACGAAVTGYNAVPYGHVTNQYLVGAKTNVAPPLLAKGEGGGNPQQVADAGDYSDATSHHSA